MAERTVNGYKRLFEIHLLHHYWLDDGATIFDEITPLENREKRLLWYDMRSFLAVAPTAATAKALTGLGCVYKDTSLGCLVAAPNHFLVPPETLFEFVVTVQSPDFFNYTALTLRRQGIFELDLALGDKTYRYRYKENVPVLSNLTGATRGTEKKELFLSKEYPALAPDDRVEALVKSGTGLAQLTGDQPGADLQQLTDQAADMPVFVHQGDAPAIVPPVGLLGAPARGVLLSEDIPDEVLVLLRLAAIRLNDGDFSFIDGAGHAKEHAPVFQVRFKNRATVRQYFNKNTGVLDFIEPEPLPLTHFGNAGTKQKPSEGLVKAVKSGGRITQLVSAIYT
jgi:hypothetical protein